VSAIDGPDVTVRLAAKLLRNPAHLKLASGEGAKFFLPVSKASAQTFPGSS